MRRRSLMRTGLGATVLAAVAALVPEADALQRRAARRQAGGEERGWWDVDIGPDEMTDVSSELSAEEAASAGGAPAVSFAAAQGALEDGRIVRRIATESGDGEYTLVLQLMPASADRVLDTRVMRWADSQDGKSIELRAVGRSTTDMSEVAEVDAVTEAAVCPSYTRPQWVCTKVKKSFFGCCSKCARANVAAVPCGLVWCHVCLWNHCASSMLACY